MIDPELVPGLLIALPILAATLPLAAGVIRGDAGWSIAVVALSIEAALAAVLASAVYADARVVHVVGGETFGRRGQEGFAVGIELVADALSGVVVLLIAGIALAVLAYSRRAGPRGNAFHAGYLLLTGGLMGVALTGDLFNLFVFLEITGLATYALVASDRSAESAVAALKYLIIGTAGASLYLVGVGYVFVSTGTLNMVDVSRSLAGEPAWVEGPLYGEPLVVAGFGFVAVGLLTKAAIFPLHTWQPDAYAEAPDAVTVYISALVSTAAAYAFARVTWTVFTPAFFEANPAAIEVVLALAAISVVTGSALAAAQRRVKRTFAYSSVAQFGLIVLAVGLAVHPAGGESATRFAVYGAVVHLVAHAITKSGLFAVAGAIAAGDGARTVREYAGVARQRPVLSGAMALLGSSLVGVPPTVGFLGKWYVALGAVETGLWSIALVVLATTLLTLLYVARLIEKLYFDDRPDGAPSLAEPGDGVAPDGGAADDGATASGNGATPPSGPELLRGGDQGPSRGMVGIATGLAVLALVLGFAGADLAAAIDPVAEAVVDASPEVTPGD